MFTSDNTTLGVRVSIAEDSLAERLERFTVTLTPATESSVAISPSRGQATVEITDNDCKTTATVTQKAMMDSV